MTKSHVLLATAAVAFCLSVSSCGDGGKAAREKATADSTRTADSVAAASAAAAEIEEVPTDTIATVQPTPNSVVAIANSSSTELGSAINAAGLVADLNGAGPFTLFAPTDEAFNKAKSAVDDLKKPENKEKLQTVLKYHVVKGKFKSSDLKDGKELTTIDGKKLKIDISKGKIMVGDAVVVGADVEATNGIVHAIDKVLMPK